MNVVGRGSESSGAKTRTISSSSSASESVSNAEKTLKVDETGKEIKNQLQKRGRLGGGGAKMQPAEATSTWNYTCERQNLFLRV